MDWEGWMARRLSSIALRVFLLVFVKAKLWCVVVAVFFVFSVLLEVTQKECGIPHFASYFLFGAAYFVQQLKQSTAQHKV